METRFLPPPPLHTQVAQHVLRGHLYRQPGETSDAPPTEPGIMDLMAEIKLNSDYKRASAAPVWLKGGNVLNGHHAQQVGGKLRSPPLLLPCLVNSLLSVLEAAERD